MKALVITSAITFVPDNYNTLINGLADCEHVGGLLVLSNQSWSLFAKSLFLATTVAPLLGKTLLKNYRDNSHALREQIYHQANKPVWYQPTINNAQVLSLIREQHFDLVINARTRCYFGKAILQAPKLGCINIHHGLLPQQRGTLCDLWALAQQRTAGFSIHKMTETLDDGDILTTVPISEAEEKNYLDYLVRSTAAELTVLTKVLSTIAKRGKVQGTPNTKQSGQKFYKDPSLLQLWQLQKKSLKV